MAPNVTLEAFVQQWLADVQGTNLSTMELGRNFAQKMLRDWLDVDESSEGPINCDGAGDGGIDIAYLSVAESDSADDGSAAEGDTWYLVQSKYGTAFRGVP